jgi:hypothetical protein
MFSAFELFFVMPSPTAAVIHSYLKTSVFFMYLRPMAYFVPLFFNVTVCHYCVFTKAVDSDISNWLSVGYCTTYIAAALNFHTRVLKMKTSARDFSGLWGTP